MAQKLQFRLPDVTSRLNLEGAKMGARTFPESKWNGLGRGFVSGFALLLLIGSTSFAAPAPSGRPFRVVDRNGVLVGYTVTENLVAREIGANWVTFYVHTAYGIFDSNAIYVYYTTTDCSGTRYIPHYSTFAEGTRVGSQLYYPADSQVLTPQSLRVEYGSGDPGPCLAGNDLTGVYGTATTVNVDTFNLQLPFKAVQ
jgi:hypothetical protein